MKKTITIILLVAAILSATAQSQTVDYIKDGMKLALTSDTTVAFMGFETTEKKATIPSAVDIMGHHLTVTAIGYKAFQYSDIEEITLPETVKEIGFSSFYGCRHLKTVNWTDNLRLIGDWAFAYCDSLVVGSWPKNLERIGSIAFQNNPSIKHLVLPPSLEEVVGSFTGCDSLTTVTFLGDVNTVSQGAFSNCLHLETIVFKGDVRLLDDFVFRDCISLKKVKFEGTLEELGDHTFEGCTALKNIDFPYGLIKTGNQLMMDCTNLEEVTFSSGLTTIHENTFANCMSLKKVILPNTLETIVCNAFIGCPSLKSITLPPSIKTIYQDAFKGCVGVDTLTCMAKIPPELNETAFPSSVFSNATLLVPSGCETVYSVWDVWKRFKDIQKKDFDNYPCTATVNIDRNNEVVHGCVILNGHQIRKHTGTVVFDDGSDINIEIIPDEFFAVKSLQVNDEEMLSELNDGKLTVKGTNDLSINVVFTEASIGITLIMSDQGTVTFNSLCNRFVRYFITPENGWHINSISLNGEDITSHMRFDGMLKTPALTKDAVINVVYESTSAVSDTQRDRIKILADGNTVHISGAGPSEPIRIYEPSGRLVKEALSNGSTLSITLPVGQVYLVRIGNKTFKLRL